MNNVMNEEELDNIIKKISMYKKSESIILDKIKSNFKSLKNYYISQNQENINKTFFEIEKKTKVVENNHNSFITVLDKNLAKYKNTSKKVADMFDNIGYK